MYIENLKAKIISGKNYNVKNKSTNEPTGEISIMNLTLVFDFKPSNPLNNKIMQARLAKPKDDYNLEDYQINGYVGLIDLSEIPFGADVLINADIPLSNDLGETITLYDMKLI